MNLELLATKYKEHYFAALKTLDPKKKIVFDKIMGNQPVPEWDTNWFNKFIKEIAAKAEAAYEAEITKQTKLEQNKSK